MSKFKKGDKVKVTGISKYGKDMEGDEYWIYHSAYIHADEHLVDSITDSDAVGNRIVRTDQISHYVEPCQFKKGDKVKVTGLSDTGFQMDSREYWIMQDVETENSPNYGVNSPDEDDYRAVKAHQLSHYEEKPTTRQERIATLKLEIAHLEGLEDELDYDPQEWMPEEGEAYYALKVEVLEKNFHNNSLLQTKRHKKQSLGYLFKTREDADKFVKELNT